MNYGYIYKHEDCTLEHTYTIDNRTSITEFDKKSQPGVEKFKEEIKDCKGYCYETVYGCDNVDLMVITPSSFYSAEVKNLNEESTNIKYVTSQLYEEIKYTAQTTIKVKQGAEGLFIRYFKDNKRVSFHVSDITESIENGNLVIVDNPPSATYNEVTRQINYYSRQGKIVKCNNWFCDKDNFTKKKVQKPVYFIPNSMGKWVNI